MGTYRIFFKKSVEKDLTVIPKGDLVKILRRIKMLIDNPRPSSCEKLTDRGIYRLRQGDYRIVYSIQDQELTVFVVKVAHRRNDYR